MKPVLRVLDAYSLIAYLEGEAGKDRMIEIIRDARDTGRDLLLSVVNWGKVYYITLRETSLKRAEAVSHVISTLPIRLIPVDLDLAKKAAEFKAKKEDVLCRLLCRRPGKAA
jgi:PIN domain nuclease of toxin-antitoxin system